MTSIVARMGVTKIQGMVVGRLGIGKPTLVLIAKICASVLMMKKYSVNVAHLSSGYTDATDQFVKKKN